MRSSRLVALLMELSRAPHTSVARLAERHAVSSRTIQRDIAALHEMGVPVWTRTGPGGGVGLVEGWRSPLTGLTTRELRTLVIGEAASRDLGMSPDFEVARLKLLSASSGRGADVEPAQERFHVDNQQWFGPSGPPDSLPEVAQAVWSGRRLSFSYARPGSCGTVLRLVDPLGLVLKTDSWYLVAARDRRVRTYRVSRISSCGLRDEPVHRPAGFSLAEYWTRSRVEFESSVHTRPVRLGIPESSAGALMSSVPGIATRRAVESAVATDGRLEVELQMEHESIAVSQLLTVPDVEVLAPLDLRRALGGRAGAIAERNFP